MIGFMQTKALQNPSEPVQVVDRVIKHFKKFKHKPRAEQFTLHQLIAQTYTIKQDADAEKIIAKH